MPMANIQVNKNGNENNASLIRRFSRLFRDAGIQNKVKGGRYHDRSKSKLVQKEDALRRIAKFEDKQRLRKLGKIK